MEILTIMKVKWNILKRTKLMPFFTILNYIVLAFIDAKSAILMPGTEQIIFRYTYQQFFIVITSALFVNIIFNEQSLESIKSYMIIYVKNIRNEIYGTAILISIVNIGAFFIGQLSLLAVNYFYLGRIYGELFLVNMVLVSLEIIICTFLVMGLRLFLKKNILVFSIFYLLLFILIVINNVYITIPLTINIVGLSEQGYYITFGLPLWIGRIILLGMSFILFKLSIKKFGNELITM